MTIEEANIGDTIVLADKQGYIDTILRHGGLYCYTEGKVTGFTLDVAHIMKIKVLLETTGGEQFYVYENDLKFWEKYE